MHIVMSCVVNIPMWAEKSVGSIPDVLLNLCLGFQIEGISRQKSDPLLLSLGSILLLLQQHFGETLCGNTGTFNRTVINSNTFWTTILACKISSTRFCLPKSPLSKASARGGFRSLSSESSCGLDNSICWSKAGSSSPWGEEPRKAIGVEGCWGRGSGCCSWGACGCGLIAPCWLVEEEVPGTVMERKSMWGRPKK